MERQVKKLQNNLLSIRKIAGWTAEELGNRIGVTKQTISNIENKKVNMTQTQYIAIRTVLDYEVKANKENTVLPQIITLLLDGNYSYYEDDEKDKMIKATINTIAAVAAGGITGAQLANVSSTLLTPLIGGALVAGPIGAVGGLVVEAALGWMAPFMINKKQNNYKNIRKNGGKKDD